MSEPVSLRQAKPSAEETVALIEFLEGLENEIFQENSFGFPLADWVLKNYPKISSSWQRVIFGGKTAIENACDPSKEYLEWKPEINALLNPPEPISQSFHAKGLHQYVKEKFNLSDEEMGHAKLSFVHDPGDDSITLSIEFDEGLKMEPRHRAALLTLANAADDQDD